jgi:hypothetical protein
MDHQGGHILIWVKRVVVALVLFVVIGQAVRPSRTNPPVDPSKEIGATLPVPIPVAAVFERSCNDCHSNRTVWLWYSKVAPASWLVAYDVHEGRQRMNFSDWNAHTPEQQKKLLDRMCSDVTKGEMPEWQYLLMHQQARLSPPEVQAVCSWAEAAGKTFTPKTGAN